MRNNPESVIDQTYKSIKTVLEKARSKSFKAVNTIMVRAYWSIGKIIIEQEQKGKVKAGYGEYLLINLAERLTKDFGKGFDESNLRYIVSERKRTFCKSARTIFSLPIDNFKI